MNVIFMPNMIKHISRACFFFNFSGSVTDSKSVARCVAIIIIFIINNGTFLGLNLIKIIHQNQPDCINHFKIFAGSMSPNLLASLWLISLFLYESSHFLFRISSKYKPKRFNRSMFSKVSPGAKCPIASVYLYNNYFLYRNMLIFREFFKTQSDQNIYQDAPNCTKFSKNSQ